ncbi:methionine ABC transporter permease [Beduinella massiliensis]|uniref:methionine ABC transporter permease n=1 Tax=Beduinella massiliensis TaxID=1852363 RepID=UPI0031FA2839
MYEFLQGIIPNVVKTFPELTKAFFQTLQMVGVSALWSAVFGVFFGVVLVVTAPGGIMENRFVHSVLDKVINVFRSIPFVILIALLLPLTRIVMGTSIGTKGAMFPLVIGTIPFFSRQIHSALCEVDKGVIEAAQAMGSGPWEIVFRVYLREGLGGMIRGATITIINLIALSAMAGVVGGGGLGDYAIRYGFQRFQTDVTIVTVIVLLILVTLIQSVGNLLTKRLQ